MRSLERSRLGFIVHGETSAWRIFVRRRHRRNTEAMFRSYGIRIVDEFGAWIDQSQFDKEADPSFNRKVGPGFWSFVRDVLTPNWYLAWRYRRHLRQSSDDA